jgi:peroxidase
MSYRALFSEPPCIRRGFSRFGNVRENLELSHHQFAPFVLYENGVLDNFVRGLSTQTCQRFDRFFSKQLTDHLFQGDLDFGLDLFALNIQRGRDHGLPPYNDWREVCGLPRAMSWDSLLDVMDSQVTTVTKFSDRGGQY